jgi:[ribosomal protein S5]-alanine N-acetyltransferase
MAPGAGVLYHTSVVGSARAISPDERLEGERVTLRLVTRADCTARYVAWLADPEVNRYLETRWSPQPLESVRAFVDGMLESTHSYLFAIVRRETGEHVGNVKVGPVDARHAYADVSYFVGERSAWGKGLGTEAVQLATDFGFERLGLARMQAGLYRENVGSQRVLEKCGYVVEGTLRSKLALGDGRDDHVVLGLLRDEWLARRAAGRP